MYVYNADFIDTQNIHFILPQNADQTLHNVDTYGGYISEKGGKEGRREAAAATGGEGMLR